MPESSRPRLHRLLRLALTLLAVGGLTRVALRSDLFRLWLTDLIAHEASAFLGEEVLLGDAVVELFPARVTLRGLVVRSAETGEPLIAARRVRARVGLGWTGPRLRVLELDHPFVRLNLNDGALADFPGLRGDEEDDEPSEPMTELPWDELIVRDAELQLGWATAGEPGGELIVEGVNLRPALVGGLVDLRIGALSVEAGALKQATTDLRIDNIELAPDRIILPDFGLELPILRVAGRVAVIFGGNLGGHLELQARAAEISQLLPEGLRLEGDLDADITLGGTASAPDIEVNLAGQPVLVSVWETGEESRYDFGELAAVVKVRADGLRVEPLVLRWAGGRVEVEGDMAWDLSVPHAAIRAEDLSFAQIMALVGSTPGAWVEFLGDAEINVSGTLSPLLLTGPFEVNGKDLVVASGPTRLPSSTVLLDIPQARLAGDLDLHADGIHLDARELVAGGTRGEVDAWLGWVGDTPLGLDVNLYEADLSTFAPLGDVELQGTGLVKGTIEGGYSDPDIFGELDIEGFSCLGVPWADRLTSAISTTDLVNVDLTDFAALRRETTSRGNLRLGFYEEMTLEAQVLVQDGQLYDLMSMWLDVPDITGRADLTLSLAGPLYGLEGESRVALRDVSIYGEAFPDGRAKGLMREGRFTLDHLLLSRAEGAESLLARGSVGAGWAMNMEVIADGLRLETLNNLDGDGLIGRLDADLAVGGTLFSPEPRGRLTLRDAKAAGGFIADARVDLRTAEEVMSFAGGMLDGTVKVSGRVGLFNGQRWRAAFELYDLPIDRYIVLGGYGEPARLSFTGRGEANGALGLDEPLNLIVTSDPGDLSFTWDRHALTASDAWSLKMERGEARTEGLRLVGEQTDLSLSASRSEGGGALIAGGGRFDLGLIELFTGETLRAEGVGELRVALNRVEDRFDGALDVTVEEATFRTDAFPHPFERVAAHIIGRPSGYVLLTGQGEVGGGAVTLGGSVEARDWVPVRYDLTARLIDARVRYFDFLPPMIADADLALGGPPDSLLLSGDIRIQDMVFSERVDWEQWAVDFREQQLSGLVAEVDDEDAFCDLDLTVTADGTARVRNNIADGQLDADLRVIGSTARPGMVGEVRMLSGGRMFHEDREFVVTRAELHYVDPWTWDPELDFVLETDISSRDRSYHVTYPVSGPFSDWRADPRSDPPLAQSDINALILFGVTREEIERAGGGGGSAIAMEGLDLLLTGESQRALERLGDGVLQDTHVELVTGVSARGSLVSSEWRVLVEKPINQPVDATLIGEFNPFRLNDQYLAVEKQLAHNVYLNVFWASFQRERNLSIGGAYGADFKVRWEAE
ncbi:translocation/assembly module TamB domain-containing protein [Myxococcota bacterium]|nr:translocation/assembly module TamB domain-containing protein [Myxococcota bacterium]